MVFDPISVLVLFAGMGVLFVLPGAAYVRWLFPDRTILEAVAAGYGLMVSALVAAFFSLNFGLGVEFTRGLVLGVYGALVLPLAWPLARGFPQEDRRRLVGRWTSWITERRLLLGLLGLVLVGIATYWAGHSNIYRSYPWPHHVDSYIHWGNARAMMDHGGLPYRGWLSGSGMQGPTDETGFWYLLAALSWLTGLSLPQVAIHGKLAFVAALALAAWAYGSRDETPFGVEAALLVPLIPTTHRFLGPMFLVPMTVVLTLALGAGVLAGAGSRGRALPAVLLLGLGGLLVHSATAGVVALIAGWRLLLDADDPRDAVLTLGVAAVFAVGFLLVVTKVPYLHGYWESMIDAWRSVQPVTQWGKSGGGAAYLREHLTRWPIPLFGLGVVAAFRARRPDAQALVLSLPPIIAIMVTYERWTRGYASLYDRTHFYLGFLFLVIAAVGLAEARRAVVWILREAASRIRGPVVRRTAERLRRKGPGSVPGRALLARALAPSAALVLATALGGVVTAGGAGALYTQVHPVKKATFYNTFPENDSFELYLEIRENLDKLQGADLALLDPVGANEFAAITGLHVWSLSAHPFLRPEEAANILDFLDAGCKPLDYLNMTGAEMVVGAECSSSGDHFEKAMDRVYLYRPALDDAS